MIVDASPEQIRASYEATGKRVLTFGGYSGAGYEAPETMLATAREVLAGLDPTATVVNAGATAEGIGAVYPLAAALGFETRGIVSSLALELGTPMSDAVGTVFVVRDATWGGVMEGSGRLSPTSRAMVDVTDLFVAIGGGAATRDEMKAAAAEGTPIRFFPADMNHARALAKAVRTGAAPPRDFRGEAHAVFG